jgi:hypothetical protein
MKTFFAIVLTIFLTKINAKPLENEIQVERKINPEELSNQFEGDIDLSQDSQVSRGGRSGLIDSTGQWRWPKNALRQVIVPYKIQGSYCK